MFCTYKAWNNGGLVITPDRQCCIIRPSNGVMTMCVPPCHTNVSLSHVTWALVLIIMVSACNYANVIQCHCSDLNRDFWVSYDNLSR